MRFKVIIAMVEEDHQENAEETQDLPVDLGEPEQQTLGEERERQHERQVEDHAPEHVAAGGEDLGAGLRFIGPRLARLAHE